MKFGYTILYVNDVTETIAFYHKVFGLQPGFLAESKQYGELLTGSTKLAFVSTEFVKSQNHVSFEEAALDKATPPMVISLVTDEVEKAYDKAVTAGAIAIKKPEVKPWGQLVAYLRDNNGFLVEICSPLD